MTGWIRGATALVGVAVCVAGCGTAVDGVATAPSGVSPSARATVPVPAGLDTGAYPTTPYPSKQGDVDAGWVAEGNRMVDATIDPADVAPDLTERITGEDAVPILESFRLEHLPKEVGFAFAGMKVTVLLTRADAEKNPTRTLRIGLLRFNTAADAAKTLTSLGPRMQDLPRAALPSAADGEAAEFADGTVGGFVAVGPLILYVGTRANDTAEATRLAEKALSLQLAALAKFRPTPDGDILSLPVDRDSIMRRTLWTETPSSADSGWIGFLTPIAFARRIGNANMVPYTRAGVDLIGWNLGLVLRTRDAAAATDLLRVRAESDKGTPEAGVPQLPDAARCLRWRNDGTFSCFVTQGRYIGSVSSDDLANARQRAAAQWVILATAR